MKLQINGDWQEITVEGTIEGLLRLLHFPAAAALVEHNGTALRREDWASHALQEGDRIEVIRIVAGG